MDYSIRKAKIADAQEILDIYAYYIEHTSVSFETAVPTTVAFEKRIHDTMSRYPYLVAEGKDGTALGYAYAVEFMSRAAYQWNASLSIYLAKGAKGKGIGRKLYESLFAILKYQGFMNAYACIAHPYAESEAFHEKMGFHTVAHFPSCGFKNGSWHDIVWMARGIEEKGGVPREITPFRKISKKKLAEILEDGI